MCDKDVFELDSLGVTYSDFWKNEDDTGWTSCTGTICASVIIAYEITDYGYLLKLAGGVKSKVTLG